MNTARRSASTVLYILLGMVAAFGLGVGIIRLLYGLGPTTSLSDAYPWGLWIVYDVVFVPFSAGAFMILAVAHIYNQHEYHAIARPVVLAGFLGEIMVVAVLVMDLGRWHQFYNVLIPWYWNFNSFMFQVSICLTVYMGIMILELAPIILERLKWTKPLKLIRALTVLVASIGIVLSVLHQASLGSLFLLMPYKLHPIWWTPILPLLFLTSAAFGGLAMAIFVVSVSFRAFHRRLDQRLLAGLAKIAAVLIGIYLVMKVADLVIAGEVGLLFTEGWLSVLFWAEMIVGVVFPLILFGVRRYRESKAGLLAGSVCVLLGLFLNRTNVALLAERAPLGATYVPSWMEIVISVAAVAAGVLIFALAVRYLPILPERAQGEQGATRGWSRKGVVLTGAALLALTVGVVLVLQPAAKAATTNKDGNDAATSMVEQGAGCRTCHLDAEMLAGAGASLERSQELLVETPAVHSAHGNILCVTCHHGNDAAIGLPDSGPGDADLTAIHEKVITDPSEGDTNTCLACHHDLPAEFPEDRLRTPHDEIAHGEAAGVVCSDCHGAVGHGFDPVSGETICPMGVCLDCHASLELETELTDCDACHIGAHEPVPGMDCTGCHQSTESWQTQAMEDHPLALTGAHGRVPCLDCHASLELEAELTNCDACHTGAHEPVPSMDCAGCHQSTESWETQGVEDHPLALTGAHERALCLDCHQGTGARKGLDCADCHEAPGDQHYGTDCENCHTPESFADARLPTHVPVLEGRHQKAPCAGCHDGSQATVEYECANCHPRPEGHLTGDCTMCHSEVGWSESVSFAVNLAPQVVHGLEGQENCLACHDVDSEIKPAPCNHGDYLDAQCGLCHKVGE